jgi:predicted ATPase
MASNLSALKPVQQQQQLAYWRCRTRLLQATHTAQRHRLSALLAMGKYFFTAAPAGLCRTACTSE